LLVADAVERAGYVADEPVDLVEDHAALVGTPFRKGFLPEERGKVELLEKEKAKVP
jgi:hypothetical protein